MEDRCLTLIVVVKLGLVTKENSLDPKWQCLQIWNWLQEKDTGSSSVGVRIRLAVRGLETTGASACHYMEHFGMRVDSQLEHIHILLVTWADICYITSLNNAFQGSHQDQVQTINLTVIQNDADKLVQAAPKLLWPLITEQHYDPVCFLTWPGVSAG